MVQAKNVTNLVGGNALVMDRGGVGDKKHAGAERGEAIRATDVLGVETIRNYID